jgi:anaerobic selenocysteine-containing dehydrogenase
VQGIGSVGVMPKLKQVLSERMEAHFGIKLPTGPGLDTLECLERADAGRLKAGFCLGGNLYGASPEAGYAARALGKLDLLVYLNTTLNTGHAHGLAAETLILPVLARDGEPQPTTQESMFNLVRLSDGGPARHAGPRSEVDIIAELGERLLDGSTPINWPAMRNTSRIRAAIAAVVPGFEKIGRIDRTKQEFAIGGRILHEPSFPTKSGRAKLHTHVLPELAGGDDGLRLMTVRSEGQFNTVVYEEYDLYRGQDRRDVILLHPDDIQRLGLRENQRVTVQSEAGTLTGILVRPFCEIKAGNALMYYPEANVLVPRHADPLSKTPAFKCVVVTVEASGAAELPVVANEALPASVRADRKPLPSC